MNTLCGLVMLAMLGAAAWWLALLLLGLALGTFLLPQLVPLCYGPQDLGKKYGAKWAVVTGGSSGIGLAIAHRLASQGVSLLIVALDDAVLKDAIVELRAAHPGVQFVAVGADFSKPGGVAPVAAAMEKLGEPVRLLVSNAGYLLTGFFADVSLPRQLANFHTNATAAVELAHIFLTQLRAASRDADAKRHGAVVFTSSPAGLMACPFSSLYGATKAFLTEWAISLAPELRSEGIDVGVILPSPVASNFYTAEGINHQIDAMEFFKQQATGPEVIADVLCRNLGRAVVIDQGWYPLTVRALLKIVDEVFLCELIARIAHTLPDFKRNVAARKQS